MRVLVTGAGGFVGRHLVAHLLRRGHEVFAAVHRRKHPFPSGTEILVINVLQVEQLQNVLGAVKPDAIVHLAAQSMVGISWNDPGSTFAVNVLGTINLLEAVRRVLTECKVLAVGSSEEYGLTAAEGVPLTEDHPCRPQNPYAVSKFAMGQIALQFAGRYGLRLVHARPFNHFGPGQQEGYVVSDFASQVARIEAGLQPPVLRVGDLTAKRDFTDVHDVVEAYAALLEADVENGVYNVCSGVARSVGEVLQLLLSETAVPIDVEADPERFRPAEVLVFVGSVDKIARATGWRPRREFTLSLRETLAWWRERVGCTR